MGSSGAEPAGRCSAPATGGSRCDTPNGACPTGLSQRRYRGVRPHALRHTFATALLGWTGDLRLVQAAMNHASIVSTTIYTTVDREKLRAAVGS